ncbi:MAG: asparagine synthase B [candidate division KSB1 bacterium]|nr:asparagine synthase B [candidate division KSB1 bacterium]
MCGIAGCYGKPDKETILRMMDAMDRCGPDDKGIHSIENGSYGHTRLSIVDVQGGHQPILATNSDKGLICNGEIYNYKQLKQTLDTEYKYNTESDTEVILPMYQEKGAEFVKDLEGMFAFAIFSADSLFLARDPIGIKPLYYGYYNDQLYFSSELGAMSHAGVDKVEEFPAGHYYTPETGFVRYYEVPEVKENRDWSIDKAAGIIRETFTDSVDKRLLSDPDIHVGAFCSGGLDSSLVSAIAAQKIPHLHTFAVGMKDKNGEDSDDLKAARIVADHIDSTHHELIFTEQDYYEALPQVVQYLESYDPSLVRCAVPGHFTCKLAAEHVTVVLTGEGADEVFTGYQYMKNWELDSLNQEAKRCLNTLHNINLQRADRMGMRFSLELRVPFLDARMIDLGMKLPPEWKIREHNGAKIEKWILRHAFQDTNLLPDEILWRYKVQYTQGAGCESLGEQIAGTRNER